jgi:hypothetical protein
VAGNQSSGAVPAGEVLAALGEVSSALARAGAPKRQSRPNVVSFSDYKRSTLARTMTKDIDTLESSGAVPAGTSLPDGSYPVGPSNSQRNNHRQIND